MNLFDRLFSKAMIQETGCWEYSGAKNNMGYGVIRVDGKYNLLVHRLAYDLVVEEIPPGINVLHRCDNPPCLNPEHLFLGSMKDNSIDMAKKNRHSGILKVEQVVEIKKALVAGATGKQLAEIYGVGKQTIYAIKQGRNWSHV